MRSPLRFPIRLKILIATLFVVTGVVGAITFTMANLFHADKKAYITGLVSMMTLSTAEESRSVLGGYQERLLIYARIMTDDNLDREQKTGLLESFFNDFPELVAVRLLKGNEEVASAYNSAALDAVGLDRADLVRDMNEHPLPLERIRSSRESYIRNSTLSKDLPTLTLALELPDAGVDPEIVSAVINLETLMRLSERAEGFEIYLTDSEGTLLVHRRLAFVVRRQKIDIERLIDPRFERGEHSAGVTKEYVQNGIDMIGGLASVHVGGLYAGVQIPRAAAFLASRNLLMSLLLVALVLLLAAAVASLFWAHRITRPVERLSEATREIAKGDFEIKVRVDSRDEIGALASSFNRMTNELKHREDALDEAQAQLIQSEKLAAFGQLGAGIAHEVKNPLAGILGVAQLSLRKAEPQTLLEKNLRLIEKETKRCKTIIENLLRFARQEPAILEPIAINPVVRDAVAIVQHQLEMNKVELVLELSDDLPRVHGNANQLQQVLMNLMINAQQALEGEPGKIRIRSCPLDSGGVELRVEDTGPGIPPEIQEKLFEPFFTTKPGGKGTGLGLSVSFGIVKDHGGEISIESTPGDGASFIIALPRLEQHKPDSRASA